MEIKNLKEFKALIKACRSLGVNAIEVSGIKANLGPLPFKRSNTSIQETSTPEEDIKVPMFNGPISDVDPIKTEDLTEDQLMFYSAQGHEQVEQ